MKAGGLNPGEDGPIQCVTTCKSNGGCKVAIVNGPPGKHYYVVILENNRLLSENSQSFVKITSQKLTIFQKQPVILQNSKL